MITKIEFNREDTMGFEAKGEITQKDYIELIKPIFDKARSEGTKLRLLFHFGSEFKSFTSGAAWEDFKLGLGYMRTLQRCAIVSDTAWIRNMGCFFGSFIPCSVQVFKNIELDSAKAWLMSGEIGLNHDLDEQTGVLSIEISSPLTSNNFETLANTVDSWVENNKQLKGIVIHTEKFPGWEDLGSFISHMEFVKNHHRKVRRIALVVDGVAAAILPKIGQHFVEAEVKQFDYDKMEDAKKWAAE